MTAPAALRQADLTRILRAAKAADVEVSVEIEPGGKVIIMPLRARPVAQSNPWEAGDAA